MSGQTVNVPLYSPGTNFVAPDVTVSPPQPMATAPQMTAAALTEAAPETVAAAPENVAAAHENAAAVHEEATQYGGADASSALSSSALSSSSLSSSALSSSALSSTPYSSSAVSASAPNASDTQYWINAFLQAYATFSVQQAATDAEIAFNNANNPSAASGASGARPLPPAGSPLYAILTNPAFTPQMIKDAFDGLGYSIPPPAASAAKPVLPSTDPFYSAYMANPSKAFADIIIAYGYSLPPLPPTPLDASSAILASAAAQSASAAKIFNRAAWIEQNASSYLVTYPTDAEILIRDGMTPTQLESAQFRSKQKQYIMTKSSNLATDEISYNTQTNTVGRFDRVTWCSINTKAGDLTSTSDWYAFGHMTTLSEVMQRVVLMESRVMNAVKAMSAIGSSDASLGPNSVSNKVSALAQVVGSYKSMLTKLDKATTKTNTGLADISTIIADVSEKVTTTASNVATIASTVAADPAAANATEGGGRRRRSRRRARA